MLARLIATCALIVKTERKACSIRSAFQRVICSPPMIWRRNEVLFPVSKPIRDSETDNTLEQPQAFQARMPFFSDDDVIVHRDAERLCDLHDRLCHFDVGG